MLRREIFQIYSNLSNLLLFCSICFDLFDFCPARGTPNSLFPSPGEGGNPFASLQTAQRGVVCHFASLQSAQRGVVRHFASLQSAQQGVVCHFVSLQSAQRGGVRHFASLQWPQGGHLAFCKSAKTAGGLRFASLQGHFHQVENAPSERLAISTGQKIVPQGR